jgi:tRNA modification GTPase
LSSVQRNGVRLLTAPGPGGVAVVEVRGAEALARLATLAGGRTARPGEVRLVRLTRPSSGPGPTGGAPLAAEDLDEALLVGVDDGAVASVPVSAGTLSGAGAEAPLVELHLHGSPPLVDEVLQLLAQQHLGGDTGASTRRGATFEARAEARLAEVPTELGARILVDQKHGALRRELAALGSLSPTARSARLGALVARTDALRHLFVPVRVVLAGPVNAGKSTLFNLLAGEERAVVSPEPGTTRDAIGADLTLGPYALRLVDTAGARELDDAGAEGFTGDAEVERAGQAVARALVATADVVLCLARAGEPACAAPATARRSVTLRTCADLVYGSDPAAWPPHVIGVSAAPAESRTRVLAALLEALALPMNPDWVRGEAVLCEEALRAEAARVAEARICDDRALAHLVALLDR